MKGKYVIFESMYGIMYPVLLSGVNHFVNHKDLKVCSDKPISAGFFSIDQGNVYVSGESISLKLKSRPEDAEIIQKFLVAI